MKWLIDGYNLLHAVTSLGPRLGPDELRRRRKRFLNDLAHRLGPVEASHATVVFDARDPPAQLPLQSRHKGMTVIFAVAEEDADTRIEEMIREHAAPRSLTVVSSDRRIRRAAARRKARAITADEFWGQLRARPGPQPPPPDVQPAEPPPLTEEESAYWQQEFRELAESPEGRQIGHHADWVPSDEEIARIEREVEREEP
jgi:predicted RNA-binding protein with PIN domain